MNLLNQGKNSSARIPLKKYSKPKPLWRIFPHMNPPNLFAPPSHHTFERRTFLRRLALSTVLFAVPGAFAEELLRTPRQTEGPFYPDKLPLDTDNDLIIVNDSLTPAVGEITHLFGRILDGRGMPIRNALVEIWQVDNNGVYLNSHDTHARRDQ